jgi:hypothetical protein
VRFRCDDHPGSPGTDPVETVLKGGADFGVASSELVLLRQRRPSCRACHYLPALTSHFVRARDAGIDTVHDLAGHKVALARGKPRFLPT